MNDLETIQKFILGVFLVAEVYFGDLHYIRCFCLQSPLYLSRNVDSIDCICICMLGTTSYITLDPLSIPGVVSHKIKSLILSVCPYLHLSFLQNEEMTTETESKFKLSTIKKPQVHLFQSMTMKFFSNFSGMVIATYSSKQCCNFLP